MKQLRETTRSIEAVIEDMREAYRRSQEYLQTTKASFKQEEVEKMDLPSVNDEELQQILRKKY